MSNILNLKDICMQDVNTEVDIDGGHVSAAISEAFVTLQKKVVCEIGRLQEENVQLRSQLAESRGYEPASDEEALAPTRQVSPRTEESTRKESRNVVLDDKAPQSCPVPSHEQSESPSSFRGVVKSVSGLSAGLSAGLSHKMSDLFGIDEGDGHQHSSQRLSATFYHNILTATKAAYQNGLAENARSIGTRGRECVLVFLICCNSVSMGFQLQYQYGTGHELEGSTWIDMFFCIAFVLELFIRILAEGLRTFFMGNEWKWDIFDTAVVALMVVEWILAVVNPSDNAHKDDPVLPEGLGVLRMLRFLRAVRILRGFRSFRLLAFFRSGRLVMLSITRNFKVFAWIIMVYISMMYILALILASGTLRYCEGGRNEHPDLCKHFGSLGLSCWSITKVMLGGLEWGDLYEPLEVLNWPYITLFMLYIAFVFLVLFHIVTGVFVNLVHSTAEVERHDHFFEDQRQIREKFTREMVEYFHLLDVNHNGALNKEEMADMFNNDETAALLASFELDTNAASTLFDLIDVDKSGQVQIDEFVMGCMNLKGHSRAVEVEKLHREVQALRLCVLDYMGPPSALDIPAPGTPEHSTEAAVAKKISYMKSGSALTWESGMSALSDTVPKQLTAQKPIPKTEMRAMLVTELDQVVNLINAFCSGGAWSKPDGSLLSAEKVNLYDFNYHVISPWTASASIMITGLESGHYRRGGILTQYHPNGEVLGLGEILEEAQGDTVQIKLVKGQIFASQSHFGIDCKLFLDDDDCGVPKKVVNESTVSFKELLSSTPTPPNFYCCHWWGEPIIDFVTCIKTHARARCKNSYWVCAYANRQHDLGLDISDDPEDTAFRRAMRLSEGMLLVLDSHAMPFQRIWCDFELFSVVRTANSVLDIITHRGHPRLLTESLLPGEQVLQKTLREGKFPLPLLAKGVQLHLENGDCTVKQDKMNILHSMGKDPKSGIIVEGLREENIDIANRTLRAYFALAAWPQALKQGMVRNFPYGDKSDQAGISLPTILSLDIDRTSVQLTFSSMEEVTDAEMISLAQGLPPALSSLILSCESCVNITDIGLSKLAGRLITLPLKTLSLDFVSCRNLTDSGLSQLAVQLPKTLVDVALHFAFCPNISATGVTCLAQNFPQAVKNFKGTFRGTKYNEDLNSVHELRKLTKSKSFNRRSVTS